MIPFNVSSFEKKVFQVIIENHLPFYYVGNFTFFVKDKNPDFKHMLYNWLIEVYYSKIHEPDYVNIRNDFFNSFGYQVLFLNENDMNRADWQTHCLQKINEFISQHQRNQCQIADKVTIENFQFRGWDINKTYLKNSNIGKCSLFIINEVKNNPQKSYSRSDLIALCQNHFGKNVVLKAINVLVRYHFFSKNRHYQKMIYLIDNIDISIDDILFEYSHGKDTTKKCLTEVHIFDDCATEILKFVKNMTDFVRSDLTIINNSFSHETVTKALRKLRCQQKITLLGSNSHAKYHINNENL